jgi:hypothetical protein
MAANDVTLNIVANTEKALSDIKSFGNAVKGVALGAAAFLGGRAIFAGIEAVVNEASEGENALNSLNSALKLSGDFSNEASKQMQEFASKMQDSTGVADDVIVQQLAMAKSFGASNEQATKLVDAALNLSAATGQSLESSVRNLGKSLGGMTGELGEMIPALKDMTAEQLKAGEAIGFVLDRFGGAAADKMNTFTGAVTAMKTAQGELLETLGDIIIKNPVVIETIKTLTNIIQLLTGVVKDNSAAASTMLGNFIKLAAQGINPVIKGITFFIRAGQGMIGLTKLMSLGLDEVRFGLLSFNHAILKTINDLTGKFGDKLQGYTEAILENRDATNKNAEELANMIQGFEKFNDATDGTVDEITKLVDNIQKIGDAQKASSDKAIDALGKYKEELDKLPSIDDKMLSQGTSINEIREIDNKNLNKKDDKLEKGAQEKIIAEILDAGKSFLSGISKGAEGAADFFSKFVGSATDIASILLGIPPIFGDMVSQLFSFAAKGPEHVEKMIEGFADALPNVINVIAESLPIIIEKLAEKADVIITALVEATPRITGALIKASPQIAAALIESIAELFQRFIEGFIYNFEPITEGIKKVFGEIWEGLKQFVTDILTVPQKIVEFIASFFENFIGGLGEALQKLFDGISLHEFFNQVKDAGREFFYMIIRSAEEFLAKLLAKLDPTGGDGTIGGELGRIGEGVKDFVKDPVGTLQRGAKHAEEEVRKILGFASGGQVPDGFPNDTFPARLTSGELVIPPGDTERLSSFLDRELNRKEDKDAPVFDEQIVSLLAAILSKLSDPMQARVQLNLDSRTLSDSILNLSRRNARLGIAGAF